MNNEKSIFGRVFRVLLYGVFGFFLINIVTVELVRAIEFGSINNLSFVGGYRAYVVNGYQALLVHLATLVFGIFFLIFSIEQILIIKKQLT